MKSLAEALSSGLRRPLAIKASLQSWLGVPISLQDGAFWREWGGTSSWTGETVTAKGILQLGTAMACVKLLTGTVATLPFNINRRGADGFPVPDTNHNLYELLHNQPNADMTAVAFWRAFVASLLLVGMANVEKQVSGKTIVALDFLMPDCLGRRRTSNGTWVWEYTHPVTGKKHDIPDERMWRMPAFSLDGINGLSAMAYGTNVFGAAMAAGRASSETFKNGMKSPGLATVDQILKAGQRDEIRAHIKKVGQEGGVMVLEKGYGYHPLTMNPQDAELLLTRDFNDIQICQFFQCPPHMVGITSKATSWGTGIEEMKEGFVAFVIRHLCVDIEQSVRKNLMSPVERLTFSAEFALEGLLRGLSATRAAFYATAVQNGWLTRNEVRRLEGKPPLPGGDMLTVQSNLVELQRLGEAPPDMTASDAIKAWLGIQSEANSTARAETAAAINNLRGEMKAPQPINVDARTTVAASPPANITVNVPEQQPSPINVDARTTVNSPPASDVTVNVPEQKAPDVHIDVAAPVVNMTPAPVTVNIEASDGEQTTTYTRDPETKEISSSTTKRK